MTHDELSWLETRLALRLPAGYRALVTAYPEHVAAYLADYDLLEDPREVVIENLIARRSRGGVWPRTTLVVGIDERGRRICLDTTRDPSPVLAFDAARWSFEEIAPSFEVWWPRLVRELEDAG